jgi:hypothetical protein
MQASKPLDRAAYKLSLSEPRGELRGKKAVTSWDEQSSPRLRQLALSSFLMILAIAIIIKYGTYLIIVF